MLELFESKLMTGTVILFLLMFFIGGVMTRDISVSTSISETSSINM